MPVEPTNKIYGTFIIRRKEDACQSSKKKLKKQKKESEKGEGKVDIKI